LKAGDMILKVAQGNEEPVDIVGMRTTDAVKLIRGKKGTVARLTVKKPDGQIVEIPIVRDVVVLEETFAKSAVITHVKTGRKIGYIFLPVFYDDFTGDQGRNSAKDVKKELEKLNAKKVDGVILDLRNNGGGALKDAVNMAGLFVPKGPVVQVKDRKNRIDILENKTPASAVSYQGPLIVLVNQFTASASEILSGALQDYNRAVIVGTVSYGKGTVQAVINLDQFVSDDSDKSRKLGGLSITIQQFYRITGSSIQAKGVTPDIVLPDRYDFVDIGEKYLDNALKWNSVPVAAYTKIQPDSPGTAELIEKSKARTQVNPSFELLDQYVKKIKNIRESTLQSLQLSEVMKRREQLKKESEKLEKTNVVLSSIKVSPSAELEKKELEGMDKIAGELQADWFKNITQDLLLGEAVEIMNDMIDSKKNK
jgi:carboxyl-terminal processing protease